jgi:hypothetical protein
MPASQAIAQSFTRNLIAGRNAPAPESIGARERLGMEPENGGVPMSAIGRQTYPQTPLATVPVVAPRFMSSELFAPETTTGQPITPELAPAPGGGFQVSARPDVNQYPAPIGPPVANVRPPTVNVDQLLKNVVGAPSMEELERRRRAQQVAELTPYRTNQY